MLNIGVIGFGYWGPNLVRNFVSNEKCSVKMVADKNPERLKLVKKLYPSVNAVSGEDKIIGNPGIDAVIIATPISTHYALAKKALLAGKHVLVEKPITNSKKHAIELVRLARKYKKILLVDHIFLYHGAVNKIKELIDKGDIGEIEYFDSIRVNLGLFQQDSSVIWDLAVHDLSILDYLINEKVKSVIATGISHTKNSIENIAYLTLKFKSNRIAHINSSWTSPVKIRQILIGGTKKMIVYNDVEPTEKIKVYDTGYTMQREKALVDYRIGDVYIPKFDQSEALANLTKDFIRSILTGASPVSNGERALTIINILEGAQASIKANGKEVFLHENAEHK
ncbi:MAG: Gfo/Idh/MocA family oxidoreductase [Candidatus Omnitrophica bacterium]|nr:Gfo/Idh/MocA family oxidoreductase [Candidatus Omnitrophota bacterium]